MPKIVDHDAYREELTEKYFEHFAKRGYADVTMKEIASDLGVSTGTLYHYFPSKKSILEHMFQLASRRDVSEAAKNINEKPPWKHVLKQFVYVMKKESWYQISFCSVGNSLLFLMNTIKPVDLNYEETLLERDLGTPSFAKW